MFPKYITLPVGLAIFCIIIAVYGFHTDGMAFLQNNWLTLIAEVVVIVALFFVLRYQYRRRKDN